ncbi:MAG: hypothetical protein JWO36_4401 [Myxococcales bacterium]|nr:hypothetical protein [Myxococcales bacterium]
MTFNSQKLAQQTEDELRTASVDDDDDPFKEWGIEPAPGGSRLAAGTTPPHGVRPPVMSNAPAPTPVQPPNEMRARSATIHDPLTTSLLAEVARRAPTVDMSPDDIEDALDSLDAGGEPGTPSPPSTKRH